MYIPVWLLILFLLYLVWQAQQPRPTLNEYRAEQEARRRQRAFHQKLRRERRAQERLHLPRRSPPPSSPSRPARAAVPPEQPQPRRQPVTQHQPAGPAAAVQRPALTAQGWRGWGSPRWRRRVCQGKSGFIFPILGAGAAGGDGQRLSAERVEPRRVCGRRCGGQRTAADADRRP